MLDFQTRVSKKTTTKHRVLEINLSDSLCANKDAGLLVCMSTPVCTNICRLSVRVPNVWEEVKRETVLLSRASCTAKMFPNSLNISSWGGCFHFFLPLSLKKKNISRPQMDVFALQSCCCLFSCDLTLVFPLSFCQPPFVFLFFCSPSLFWWI